MIYLEPNLHLLALLGYVIYKNNAPGNTHILHSKRRKMVAQQLVTIPEKKVIFCGGDVPKGDPNCRVGKTSIVQKLIVRDNVTTQPTLGVEVHPLEVVKGGAKHLYNIWDIGSYYAGDNFQEFFVNADYVFVCHNSTKTEQLAKTYWKDMAPEGAEIFYIDTNHIDVDYRCATEIEHMLFSF